MVTPIASNAARFRIFSVMLLLAISAHSGKAQSATWRATPGSGDWNTAGNWVGGTVPSAGTDTATFGVSSVTGVSFSANTEVGGITFDAGASAYTITSTLTATLSFGGDGIANNSGVAQNFATVGSGSDLAAQINFTNSATAGSNVVFTNASGTMVTVGGITSFSDRATAGNATFISNGGATLYANGGYTAFFDTATAGNGTFTAKGGTVDNSFGGYVLFYDSATAGNGVVTNDGGVVFGFSGGHTYFYGSSTAGHGIFTNSGGSTNAAGGGTAFADSSTAGQGTFTNHGGTSDNSDGGYTGFQSTATAGDGTFINNGGTGVGAQGGHTSFEMNTTAGNAIFINNGSATNGANGGYTSFGDTATAGDSTLIATGGTAGGRGGAISFAQDSTGGTATVKVYGNGSLDIAYHNASGLSIGSIEGTGKILLGINPLTVGSNDRSTTFSGVITEGGGVSGGSGSIAKIGSGTLTLSGANTYTGGTTISAGALLANNASGSAFGTGAVMVSSGATLGGNGLVGGLTTVANGGHLAPGNSPGTLTFTNGLTFASGAILDFQLGTSGDRIDVTSGLLTGPGGTGGITLNLANAGGFATGTSYTLFNFVSGQTSIFDVGDFRFGSLIGSTVAEDYSFTLSATSLAITYNGSASAIPEPATYAMLMGVGTLGLVLWRRRRSGG